MKLAAVAFGFLLASSTLVAQSSHLDEVRAHAATRFGPALASVKKEVDQVDTARRRYATGCHGTVTTIRPVYPAGIPLDDPPTATGGLVSGVPATTGGASATPLLFEIDNESTAECRLLRSDIMAGVASIEHRLADISEQARRAGIYPGVMRDLRSAHGLKPFD